MSQLKAMLDGFVEGMQKGMRAAAQQFNSYSSLSGI